MNRFWRICILQMLTRARRARPHKILHIVRRKRVKVNVANARRFLIGRKVGGRKRLIFQKTHVIACPKNGLHRVRTHTNAYATTHWTRHSFFSGLAAGVPRVVVVIARNRSRCMELTGKAGGECNLDLWETRKQKGNMCSPGARSEREARTSSSINYRINDKAQHTKQCIEHV